MQAMQLAVLPWIHQLAMGNVGGAGLSQTAS